MNDVVEAAFASTIPNPYVPNKLYRWNKTCALYINTKRHRHIVRIESKQFDGKILWYDFEDYLVKNLDETKYKGSIHREDTLKKALSWLAEQTT